MHGATLCWAPLLAAACLASGAWARAPQWSVDTGLSARELAARADAMRGDGFAPVSLSANGERIAVVWVEGGATEWKLTVLDGSRALDAETGDRRDNGWRPTVIAAWQGPSFAVIWVRDGVSPDDWDLDCELTPDEYQASFDTHYADGMRPVGICAYGEGDAARIGAAWVRDGKGLDAVHGLPGDWLQDRLTQGRRHGARLLQVAPYESPGYPYAAAVSVREAQPEWEDETALTADELAVACETRRRGGWVPTCVAEYGPEDALLYVVSWTRAPEPAAWQATGPDVAGMESFDRETRAFMEARRTPRGAVAVAKDGRLVYSRGYALAPAGAGPTRPDSLFRIASLSKPLTAVAIMQLVEQGLIELDQPIAEILDLSAAVDRRWQTVTVHEVLCHWGGWDREVSGDPMFMDREVRDTLGEPLPTTPDMVLRFMLARPFDHDPGEVYSYSNFGYLVLGRVIEAVSGLGYEEYVQRNVWAPLGVTRAGVGGSLESDRLPGEVEYHDPGRGTGQSVMRDDAEAPVQYGAWNLATMDAHGGWVCSAEDYVRFLAAFTDPDDCPLLSRESIDRMWARPPWDASEEPVWYGCGWSVRDIGGGKVNVWHGGALPGTWTLGVRLGDGRCWAVFFNQRSDAPGMPDDGEADAMMHRAAAAVTEWPTRDLAATPDRDESTGFTFAEAADIHITDAESVAIVNETVDAWNADPEIAFSLWLGDLTADSKPEQMALAREALDRLTAPHYVLRGNHDLEPGVYEAEFGPIMQAFDYGGWRFLLADSNPGDDTPMCEEQREWIREQLAETDPETPIVFCCHHPLMPSTKAYHLAEADEVLALFAGHNLKAVLNGHFHGNQEEVVDGVLFTTTACLSSTRGNHDGTDLKGYRLFHCADGEITTEFVAVEP